MASAVADPDILALSPLCDTLAAMEAWLSAPQTLPGRVRTAIESDGVSLAWVTPVTTHREIVRRILQVLQVIKSLGYLGAKLSTLPARDTTSATKPSTLLSVMGTAGLTQPVSTWAPGVEADLRAYLTLSRYDTSWITGATTAREVMDWFIAHTNFPAYGHGPFAF